VCRCVSLLHAHAHAHAELPREEEDRQAGAARIRAWRVCALSRLITTHVAERKLFYGRSARSPRENSAPGFSS